VRTILRSIGEDPRREGLLLTPERVAEAWGTLTAGYREDPLAILRGAIFHEPANDMVMVREIELYSLCEHHLLPFFGKCHVAYLPKGRIVGLSKVARLVDVFSRRLQVQERLTTQIAQALLEALDLRCRRRHRGPAPLHDDARGREAEQPRGHQLHARRVP
jgi:GTP cyclohydrolase I